MLVLGTNWRRPNGCHGQGIAQWWQTFCVSKADLLHSSHKWFPTTLPCGKHGTCKKSQTGNACFKTQTLHVILRTQWQPQEVSCVDIFGPCVDVHARKLVPATAVSHSSTSLKSFLWMLDYVWVGYACSWSWGHGDWSIMFNQQQCPTPTYEHSGNWGYSSSENQGAESQKKTEGWSIEWCGSCAHRHTDLLTVNLSSTFLKTTKQWPRWLFKEEVRRWDTCPEPTELLLICYLTESIWNPKLKPNILTPKTKSLTFWPKEVSQEMNGTTFYVCSILWISRCILVAILATLFPTIPIRLESRAPCRKEVTRRLRMKAPQRRTQSHVWCCASKGVRKSLHEVWDLWSIRWMPMKDKKSNEHPGNWCHPTQIRKSDILKRIDKRMFHKQPGNWCWRIETKQKVMRENIVTPQAQGNLLHRHQSWKTWNTRTIDTWVRSFSVLQRELGMSATDEHSQWKQQNKWIWWCLSLRRWKPPSTLGRITCRIRKSTRTQNSRILRVCSTLLKSWWKNIVKKFWMWDAWRIHHFPGRDWY